MRAIGLMGGMGWQASTSYYRVINREVQARLGGDHSARLILDSLDFHDIANAREPHQFESVRETLIASARRLAEAGAEIIVIACNTVHRLAPSVREACPVPLLHIAEVAGARLRADGHSKLGLLGTEATMRSAFYRNILRSQYQLEVLVPERSLARELDRLIRDELVNGGAPQRCRARIENIVAELSALGCSAVLLACTELGLAFSAEDEEVVQGPLPMYDTAVLHALAAARFSMGEGPAAP